MTIESRGSDAMAALFTMRGAEDETASRLAARASAAVAAGLVTAASSAQIRTARECDAQGVLDIYGPIVRTSAITFEYEPPSVSEIADRIRTVTARWPWLVCARDDRVLGYAYASSWRARAAYQWAVETTVYVHADAQRRGVGRALYFSLMACLRLLGYRLAIGGITLPNPGSVALHEALGFRAAGVHRGCGWKLGAWHDVGFWELELAPGTAGEPSLPIAASALVSSSAWTRALASGLRTCRGEVPPA
jgi:phosphinothricin acetyltransferase